jgi:hypothetical protein
MRHYSEDCGFYSGCRECPIKEPKPKLHVHHVNPHGNGGSNDATNLLTIFECEHTGRMCDGSLADVTKKFVVHPDMVTGLRNYRKGNKNAIVEVMVKRKPLKEAGLIYWNTEHDEEMQQTAIERTQNAVARGWLYVNKKKS